MICKYLDILDLHIYTYTYSFIIELLLLFLIVFGSMITNCQVSNTFIALLNMLPEFFALF